MSKLPNKSNKPSIPINIASSQIPVQQQQQQQKPVSSFVIPQQQFQGMPQQRNVSGGFYGSRKPVVLQQPVLNSEYYNDDEPLIEKVK